MTVVKMVKALSGGQLVKRSTSVLCSTNGNQEVWPSLCACTVGRWSMGQGKKFAMVNRARAIFSMVKTS